MQPTAALAQPIGDVVERIERAGVDLTGLGAHEHRAGDVGETVGPHPTLVVGRHDDDPPTSEADEPE